MPLNARALILRLVLGAESRGEGLLGARELLASCALFGVDANRVRVALARAVAGTLLVVPRRACYALGPAARPLADEVGRWRRTAALLVDWQGGWLAVHVGAAGRSHRPSLRARERAFGLLGLAEFERGLYLRPDNLAGGAPALRARLQALLPAGTDAGTLFAARDLSPADTRRAGGLWDTAALNAGYRDTTARLTAWRDDAPKRPLERAAREAFELGDQAIRQLVFDPWLPAPLVDGAARRRCMAAVKRHDDLGQAIWQQFLRTVRPAHGPRGAAVGPGRSLQETTR